MHSRVKIEDSRLANQGLMIGIVGMFEQAFSSQVPKLRAEPRQTHLYLPCDDVHIRRSTEASGRKIKVVAWCISVGTLGRISVG